MDNLIFETAGGAGRTIVTESGQEFLYFGGTSYLGLAQNTEFQSLVAEGIQKYGLNYGSSRLANLQLKIYEETENFLAQKMGAEKVLTFSSGYMAGQAVTQWLKKSFVNTPTFYAPETHPAVKNFGNTHQNEFARFEIWLDNQVSKINESTENEFVLVMDSVDALRGRTRDFSALKNVNSSKRIILVVDDSHGFGILGRVGEGINSELPTAPNIVKIVVGSLGKACGVPAGFVATQKEIIEELMHFSIFKGASPVLPCFLYAFMKADNLRTRQLEILRERILFFSGQIDTSAFLFSENYPVFFALNAELTSFLYPHQIALWHFAYSSTSSGTYSRIVLNASHTKTDLEKLLTCLELVNR